ncbi:MAG: hypothetical protein AAF597_05980 [Bacteroidota bacterium]
MHLPRLFSTDTTLTLSFVRTLYDYEGPTPKHRLNLAFWSEDEEWTEQWKITEGNDFFVNWADFPSARFYRDTNDSLAFFAHWLAYSGKGTYDYDIMFSANARPDAKLHQDTVSAEHGFVSTAQLPEGGLQVTWLDGRYTKSGGAAGAKEGTEEQGEHGHGGGAMTLRTKALSDSTSVELDHRVCDCCNTATVATDSLVMVAYRDRSEHEIRDISYVIKRTGSPEWSTPKLVHADNWEIAGCPVNGPALAANGAGNIAIVWYTAPADRAQILFSRYEPDLNTWTSPTLLDNANPLGRVDLQLGEDGTAYVTALTATDRDDTANLTLWTIGQQHHNSPTDHGIYREVFAETSSARSAGFPKIALHQDRLFWAITVVAKGKHDQYVEVCWR